MSLCDELRAGDVVRHTVLGRGKVTHVGQELVRPTRLLGGRIITVLFDKPVGARPVVGKYDDAWFRIHPCLMTREDMP